jgi:hypothetical protein
MALFTEKLVEDTVALVKLHAERLATEELRSDLGLLVQVANGRFTRTDSRVEEAEQALRRVQSVLLGNALQSRASWPENFWQTDLGIVVSRSRWWISMEDLITISNAAALAFGENSQANRMRIARAMDHGTLEWVPDPSVSNPQQNRRVLRSQVERLGQLARLPEVD